MKKIFYILSIFSSIILASCSKDKGYENSDYGLKSVGLNEKPVLQILEGGITNFGMQVPSVDLSKTRDTSKFTIFYINKDLPATEDITVTIAYDAAALAKYNATSSVQYEKLPDSTFSLPKTSIIIKKGQKLSDQVDFIIFPSKVDPSRLYMLPISIISTSVSNAIISGNNGTIYYHIIGNPQAGTYTNTGIRYNYNCCTSVAYTYPTIPTGFTSTLVLPSPKASTAVDGSTVRIDFANLGGADFAYLATVPAGISGNTDFPITLTFTAAYLAGNSNIDIKLATYNPVTKTFHFNVAYLNNITGANGFRIVDEILVKQ